MDGRLETGDFPFFGLVKASSSCSKSSIDEVRNGTLLTGGVFGAVSVSFGGVSGAVDSAPFPSDNFAGAEVSLCC